MDDSESKEIESSDSRVTSFLRQAVGIIAGEKGMTPACRLKLQSLADKIKLSPEMFERALGELESTHLDVEQLTRYEKAFVAFLDSEFEKIQSDVLSPRMENAAIEIASDRFQIEPIRAWRLIESRCESRGISRISSEEAKVYAKQSILACLGQKLFIDEETQTRLYRIGKDWGLDPLSVDQITLAQVAKNRNSELNDRSSRVVPLTIVFCGLLLIGILVVTFRPDLGIDRTSPVLQPGSNEQVKGDSSDPAITVDSSQMGRSDRIRDYLKQSVEQSEFSIWLNSFVPEELDTQNQPASVRPRHAQSLAWLLNHLARNQNGRGDVELDLFCEIYLNEPSEEMAAAIQESLIAALGELTPSETNLLGIEQVLRANRVVQRIRAKSQANPASDTLSNDVSDQETVASQRWSQLSVRLPNWFPSMEDTEFDEEQAIKVSRAAIADEQWSRFATFAFSNPELASRALPNLIKATKGLLSSDEISVYRDDVLFAIVESQPELTSRLIPIGVDSITNADEPTLSRWASVLSAEGVQVELALAKVFFKRSGIEPHSNEADDVKSAIVDFRNGIFMRRFRPLMDRVERVSTITNDQLAVDPRSMDPRQLPNRIAEILVAVNLEVALCECLDAANDRGDAEFDKVDSLLLKSNPNLRESVSLKIDRDQFGDATDLGQEPTASDFRTQSSTFAMLASDEDRVAFKVSSVRQLARVASRLPSPSYQECKLLADFFLSDMPLKQRLELQQLIGSFSHWNSLALALADQLDDDNIELDRILTVARILLRKEFEIENATDWQSELQIKILQSVNDDLAQRVARDPNHENSDWTRLRLFMQEVYPIRLQLFRSLNQLHPSAEPRFNNEIQSDEIELIDTADAILKSIRGGDRQSIDKLPVANRFDRLALVNQLLIAELGNGLKDASTFTAQQLVFLDRLDDAATVGLRYLETERRLLELLRQWRSEKLLKITN